MTLEETNGLLGIFSDYWPSFELTPTKTQSWQEAIRGYSKTDAWEALRILRREKERAFAPTMSEFMGTMDAIRDKRQVAIEINRKLSREPEVRDTMEDYTYEAYVSDKKGGKTLVVKTARRCTKARRQQIEKEQLALGRVKVLFNLSGGKQGHLWRKPGYGD